MGAGRLLARGTVKLGYGEDARPASRTRLYAALTLAAGAAAGAAAAAAIGAPAIARADVDSSAPIAASALFTPVPPLRKTIDVFDPPPRPVYAPPAASEPAATAGARAPEPGQEKEHEGSGQPGGDD